MKWILIILVVWLILAAICAGVFPFALMDIFAGTTGCGSNWGPILGMICSVILSPLYIVVQIVKKIISAISKIGRGSAKE